MTDTRQKAKGKRQKAAPSIKPMDATRAIYHAPEGDVEVTVTGTYKAFGKVYLVAEGHEKGILSDKVVPIKAPDPDPLGVLKNLSVYDPETIAQNQAAFEEKSSGAEISAFVIRDEWHGQLETGRPFDDAIEPYIRDNPDKDFRFLSMRDSVQKTRGMRGYQPVRQPDGKILTVAGMQAGWIPKDEAERRRKAKLERADAQLEKVNSDYREAAAKAARDSEGAFVPTKTDDETYQGSHRIA